MQVRETVRIIMQNVVPDKRNFWVFLQCRARFCPLIYFLLIELFYNSAKVNLKRSGRDVNDLSGGKDNHRSYSLLPCEILDSFYLTA